MHRPTLPHPGAGTGPRRGPPVVAADTVDRRVAAAVTPGARAVRRRTRPGGVAPGPVGRGRAVRSAARYRTRYERYRAGPPVTGGRTGRCPTPVPPVPGAIPATGYRSPVTGPTGTPT